LTCFTYTLLYLITLSYYILLLLLTHRLRSRPTELSPPRHRANLIPAQAVHLKVISISCWTAGDGTDVCLIVLCYHPTCSGGAKYTLRYAVVCRHLGASAPCHWNRGNRSSRTASPNRNNDRYHRRHSGQPQRIHRYSICYSEPLDWESWIYASSLTLKTSEPL